jgi:hypothetical protein
VGIFRIYPYKGRSEFTTCMDLEGSDAVLIKNLIQTMFESRTFTISSHFLPNDLKPFIIFVPISMT